MSETHNAPTFRVIQVDFLNHGDQARVREALTGWDVFEGGEMPEWQPGRVRLYFRVTQTFNAGPGQPSAEIVLDNRVPDERVHAVAATLTHALPHATVHVSQPYDPCAIVDEDGRTVGYIPIMTLGNPFEWKYKAGQRKRRLILQHNGETHAVQRILEHDEQQPWEDVPRPQERPA